MTSDEVVLSRRRPMSRWKLAGVALLSLVVGLLLLYQVFRVTGNRRFAEMERALPEMMAEMRARDASRPPLRGPGVPGDAWIDYEGALREIETFKADSHAPGQYVYGRAGTYRATVERLLEDHPGVLDALRRGTARATARIPYPWEEAYHGKPTLMQNQFPVLLLAICRARFLSEAGRYREAAEVLLDAVQFAQDVASNTQEGRAMMAMSNARPVLEELHLVVVSGTFQDGDFQEIARELDVLVQSYPPLAPIFLNEPMTTGYVLQEVERTSTKVGVTLEDQFRFIGGNTDDLQARIRWVERFGGLRRLMYADLFDTHRYVCRRIAALVDKPWLEVMAGEKEILAGMQESRNPLMRLLVPSGELHLFRYARQGIAQLNLLRMGVRFRWTGEVVPLDDPFGGKLQTARTGNRLKIWSVGTDGIDDGGTGNWNPRGKDMVLDVER